MLDQDERRGRVIRDVLQDVPGLGVAEHLDAVGGGRGAGLTSELVELMVQAPPQPSWSTSGGAPPAQLIPKG
jgi:hypothetical protein